ncbi:hypothetical protein CFHF_04020 [Caulobacter flavus]|uniref:Uncharacterized protein n=1 Tax=Caulobacter flavus TaxID=1679497 RepID=A0A2N5CZE9_9CAUL|nr:type VI secretion system tip protein TssI/VgrG [Caulobacter flavus]AYV45137.1 hypothetical protein C1707_02150 [Caulobacter flavus]PLR19183.1 hypothetical protein CFHF_04020 [Caulobacter flavus]
MLIEQTQEYREATIDMRGLSTDQILLSRLSAEERLSEPFSIVVEVISQDGVIDFRPHLGADTVVVMEENRQISRAFHGVLWQAQSLGEAPQGLVYRLVLRPWLSLLSLGMDSRIFQNKTAPQILHEVFERNGFSKYDLKRLKTAYKPRDYCVQFRESDFAFVSRLMEEEGIYYFFEHDEEGHTLVLADAPSCHQPSKELPDVPFVRPGSERSRRRAHLSAWSERVSPAPQRVTLRDFHFIKPPERFVSMDKATGEYQLETAELYDYPGGHAIYGETEASGEGKRYAAARLAASRAERRSFTGSGDAFALGCGETFDLTEHLVEEYNRDFLIVGAAHHLSADSYRSGGEGGYQIEVEVEVVPADTLWRSRLKTPKPVVGGPQTATVTGPKGEVVWPDKYGRVKVQFHWDRQGKFDADTSCWVRVSHAWADAGFGTVMLPRIGEEVVIDFLDGDPDQPLITGRVYNATHMPPYELPNHKTRSTWKSRTVGKSGDYAGAEEPPRGDEPGFNELRLEDKGGDEEIFVHAQRNLKAWVRLDESRKAGRDMKVRVGRDRVTEIKHDETITVETGDESRKIAKGGRRTKINKSDDLVVETGDYSMTVEKGKVLIDAKREILLKVGSNTVKISPKGIEINGMTIVAKADTSLSAKALTAEVKAGTVLTLNGLPVLIN